MKINNTKFLILTLVLALLVLSCSGTRGKGSLTTYPKPASVITTSTPIDSVEISIPSPTAPEQTVALSASKSVEPSLTSQPTLAPIIQIVRFAVIGDYGSGDPAEGEVAQMVSNWNPDFILTTGDNNYPDGSSETIDNHIGQFYSDYIAPYHGKYGNGADKSRFFPSLGNHDWNTINAQPYLDYFELPGNERYYDFAWGPIHVFILDSDSREPDGVSRKSVQADWLQQRLASSSLPWKLVIMHHPAYSSGYHGSIDWMRWPFQEWGATAALAGHDHTYERLVIDGFPYFINGLGGGAIYQFNEIIPGSEVRFNQDYGAMLITAAPNRIVFEFYTRLGERIDQFEMLYNAHN